MGSLLRLFLCGDVMTGRGVDQVPPHPGDPRIHQGYVKSAETYVQLAEEANGPFPHPVDFSYVWSDVLEELARTRPDGRIINLETSITRSNDWEDKGINYRMHPDNVGCIAAAGIEVRQGRGVEAHRGGKRVRFEWSPRDELTRLA